MERVMVMMEYWDIEIGAFKWMFGLGEKQKRGTSENSWGQLNRKQNDCTNHMHRYQIKMITKIWFDFDSSLLLSCDYKPIKFGHGGLLLQRQVGILQTSSVHHQIVARSDLCGCVCILVINRKTGWCVRIQKTNSIDMGCGWSWKFTMNIQMRNKQRQRNWNFETSIIKQTHECWKNTNHHLLQKQNTKNDLEWILRRTSHCIAWKSAIGWPNCLRWCRYGMVASNAPADMNTNTNTRTEETRKRWGGEMTMIIEWCENSCNAICSTRLQIYQCLLRFVQIIAFKKSTFTINLIQLGKHKYLYLQADSHLAPGQSFAQRCRRGLRWAAR